MRSKGMGFIYGVIMTAALLLIAGLAGVILGANWLVDGACAVAKRLRVSELAIGLTFSCSRFKTSQSIPFHA